MCEKLKRKTIPVRDAASQPTNQPASHILMVSFDIKSDHERLILT